MCVLTAFHPSFPHLETLKKILENSTLSRYVKKNIKKSTDRPNFQILVGWGQHNIFFFLALLRILFWSWINYKLVDAAPVYSGLITLFWE